MRGRRYASLGSIWHVAIGETVVSFLSLCSEHTQTPSHGATAGLRANLLAKRQVCTTLTTGPMLQDLSDGNNLDRCLR